MWCDQYHESQSSLFQEGESPFADCELDKNQRGCIDFALNAKPTRLYIPDHPIQYRFWVGVFDNSILQYKDVCKMACVRESLSPFYVLKSLASRK